MLYIVRQAELTDYQLQTLLCLSNKDAVIFAENGVYNFLHQINCGQAPCYVVKQDCLARAIEVPVAQYIDYESWVELSKAHQKWVNY